MSKASTLSTSSAVEPTVEPMGCFQGDKLLDQTYSTKSPNISVEGAAISGYTLREDGMLQPTSDDQEEISNPELTFKFDRMCSFCNVITREALLLSSERIKNRQMPFNDSTTKLQHSVLQGYHPCALFWAEKLFRDIEEVSEHATDITPLARQAHATVRFDECLQLRYYHPSSPENDRTLWIRKRGEHSRETSVLVVIDKLEQATREIGPRNLAVAASASNASKATFDVATSWLSECL